MQTEIGILQIDRNFTLSMLQIQSWLSTLLVDIIQLNEDLEEVCNCITTLSSNVLSPSITSQVDLRLLLNEVKQDLVGHLNQDYPQIMKEKVYGTIIDC